MDQVYLKKKGKFNYRIIADLFFILFFLCANFYCYKLEQSSTQANNINDLNSKQIIPWGVEASNAPLYWSQGYTGENIKIAVMDTGVDPSHPDLKGNIQEGFNAINPNEPPLDDNGHGTLVTGIISALQNNFGITGIAPDAEIYPVKVLDKYGEGDVTKVIQGIDWCIEHDIKLINMSFAIKDDDVILRKYIQRAIDAGIIIVSSGSNTAGGIVGYPATYNGVISVTSVDKNNRIGTSSPRGKVDFSAPGVDIISTKPNGGYSIVSGTSFAAPHITGVIALMLDKNQDMTINEVIANLKLFSKHLGDPNIYGEGMVILN